MWNKFSKPFTKASRPSLDENERAEILSGVYEQHPNLANFLSSDDTLPNVLPSPSTSNPFFKRYPNHQDKLASQFKLPGFSKKVKSSLHLNTNFSEISLSRASIDSSSHQTPTTPHTEREHLSRFGSLRSILRDRNTPATGQNVRFFSRDAYKTVSPNESEASTGNEELSFLNRLPINGKNTAPARSESSRPSARDVFASLSAAQEEVPSPVDPSKSHALSSLIMPASPPDVSNIFDMSQEHETIPSNSQSMMMDSAVEVMTELLLESPSLSPDEPSSSTPYKADQETVFFSPAEEAANTPNSDPMKSFTFGQPVFRAPLPSPVNTDSPFCSLSSDKQLTKTSTRASESPSIKNNTKSRARALSDTMFQTMIRSSKESTSTMPEVDTHNTSNPLLVSSPQALEPDPFRANATTYYTPGTMIPSPQPATHTRKASREEDMIWSLRTQLALQQELAAQYEVDLSARDELVNSLTEKLESAEKEKTTRSSALRGWKKKVLELEKVCRGLEEEVDRSRQESMERSVMDEASSDALRELHLVIARFEREKAEMEKKEKEKYEKEVHELKAELKRRADAEDLVKEGVDDAEEQKEVMDNLQYDDITEQHRLAEFAWAEERAELITRIQSLEKATMEEVKMENEFDVLKEELEAQWNHSETMNEKISEVEKERDAFKADVELLEKRIANMEVEWSENENRKGGLESEFQQVVSEKNEIEEQLGAEREHAEALTQVLHEREEAIIELQNERQYALDNVSRLENNIRQRDAEIADLSRRNIDRESEAEKLREAMIKLQGEREGDANDQARSLQEITVRESEALERIQCLLKEQTESAVLTQTVKERVAALHEELERLRRQVHDLQQESADKEVRLTQFVKLREQDKEDIKGLNIALDSKQQELELMKRKNGVRGTAGSTPGPAVKRRESSMFATPTVVRPPSALSDVSKDGSKDKKVGQTPSTVARAQTLTKSSRINSSAPTSSAAAKRVEGSMGQPPTRLKPSVTAGTSARVPSTHSRTSSGSSLAQSTGKSSVIHQRASSDLQAPVPPSKPNAAAAAAAALVSSPVLNEQNEKENSNPSLTNTSAVSRRVSMALA